MPSFTALGLLGGTFDPPHHGHLILARDLRERLGLDQVVLIPAACSPFKADRPPVADGAHRLAMLRRTVRGEPGLAVSDLELARGGPSYTIDTVRAFRARHPHARLLWFVGADHLAGLPRWREAEALLATCEIWVMARGGLPRAAARRALAALPPDFRRALRGRWVEGRRLDLSASEIRARCRAGQSNKGLVPDAVRAYIRRHGLYR
jgi:nicotinate-nucleotide adenylyltransferase